MKDDIDEFLELFTFADGSVRLAWVTWRIGDGERRCVSVREAQGRSPSRGGSGERLVAEEVGK